jgi:hypothetical protein
MDYRSVDRRERNITDFYLSEKFCPLLRLWASIPAGRA